MTEKFGLSAPYAVPNFCVFADGAESVTFQSEDPTGLFSIRQGTQDGYAFYRLKSAEPGIYDLTAVSTSNRVYVRFAVQN